MNADRIVVGLTGMPGAGKSIIVGTARPLGYAVVVMGDVVRKETQRRGLQLTPENVGKVMLELREKSGPSVIADKCILTIEQQKSRKVIVDGIRSLSEVDTFKKHFSKFSLIAVHASPETRFNRLFNRRRSDDPDGWALFRERDMRELSVGLGSAIAMAEYIIVNENKKEEIIARVEETLRMIEEKWTR